MNRRKKVITPAPLDDEFLGFINEGSDRPSQFIREERDEERHLRVNLMADLIIEAEGERNRKCGIKLEKMVSSLEAYCIRLALQRCDGDVKRASIWLGFRAEDALGYMLRRHPDIIKEIRRP
jgi:hypothetical protein